MDHTIGLYIVGVLALLGGIELIRFSWADSREEDRQHNHFGGSHETMELQPGHLGVTLGAAMVVFAFVAFYGGYNGWTLMKIFKTVGDLVQNYLM